jgi:hypothetical protein
VQLDIVRGPPVRITWRAATAHAIQKSPRPHIRTPPAFQLQLQDYALAAAVREGEQLMLVVEQLVRDGCG